ncbi:MAG: hypothetical protein IJG13_20225 [Kiritimatiellae bacterium]|nr:hypothetical protein [Kiritimatiellia bacterium]MBQ6330878.1 hypothetical protein [Kiritimatiellia bacterium]
MKDRQEARNTAAGMVRDALEQLTKWDRVQDLRRFDNTKEEATRLLDLAEAALLYFERHYDFPQTETEVRQLFDPPESYEDYLLTNNESEVTK